MKRLDQIAPETTYYLRGFAVIETEIADSLLALDQTDEAFKYLQSAQAKMERVVAADPTVLGFRSELAKIYRLLAKAFDKKDEGKNCLKFIDAALSIVSKLKLRNNLIFSEQNLPESLEKERARYAAFY